MNETVKNSLKEEKEPNYVLGMITGILGAILGMGVAAALFLRNYGLYIAEEKKICPVGCEDIIGWFMPFYTDMMILGGVMSLFAAYGFYNKETWASKLLILGSVFILKFSFWPLIPAMDIGIFPEYLFIFMPAFMLFTINCWLVVKISWGRIILSMFLGMAAVTTFMSGTSATNMFIKTMHKIENPDEYASLPATSELWNQIHLYTLVQRLGWIAGITLLIATYAVLFFPKEKVRLMIIASSLIVLIYEVPLAALITELKGEFSMMYYGPIIIVIFLPVVLIPKLWIKFTDPIDSE